MWLRTLLNSCSYVRTRKPSHLNGRSCSRSRGRFPTFYEEAARIGLEYLADDEIEIDPDEDFRLADKPDDPISGRLYLAMPDLEAPASAR